MRLYSAARAARPAHGSYRRRASAAPESRVAPCVYYRPAGAPAAVEQPSSARRCKNFNGSAFVSGALQGAQQELKKFAKGCNNRWF